MCILLPGNLYLRGAVAVLNRPNSSHFPQAVVLVPTEYARQPLPHKGARLPGGRLGVFIARLTSARRPAALPFGRARRCGGLPPGSASPPRPSRGLARSGVPPSRLGRAVALSRCFYVRCRLRRPLLCRLAAAGCIQGWAIGACMNLAFARLEPYMPLSPWMQSFCCNRNYCSKYTLFY